MSEIMEDIAYLSQEIGPRPAGTEEEQQAALYIADQMKKRTGFTTSIEDFTAAVQPGLVEAICFGVAALVSLLAVLARVLVVPAFLITLVCAILYIFELIDRPLLSNVLSRGVSQNVVARYTPGAGAEQRNRKIILVANYDSSKVQKELNGGFFGAYPTLQKASAVALAALPIIWLIRTLFLLHAEGGAVIFFNALAVIASLLALVPVLVFVMHKTATYNEAANNNAAGVASMLEVARLISEGSFSEEDLAAMEGDATLHGEQAALEAGVVPEGAELQYATPEEMTDEERLASAKAAVAALTGRPIQPYNNEYRDAIELDHMEPPLGYDEFADEGAEAADEQFAPQAEDGISFVEPAGADEAAPEEQSEGAHDDAQDAPAEPAWGAAAPAEVAQEAFESAASQVEPAASAPEYTPAVQETNEPSWYTTGRAKAVKPEGADDVPVRRSRYADALDAAVAASREHFSEAARMLDEGTIERISQMQRNIGERPNGVAYDAPLQDLLSDDQPALEPEQPSAPERVFIDASTMSEDLATQAIDPIHVEETDTAVEEQPASEPEVEVAPVEEQAEEQPAPEPAEAEALPGETTAMPPIDVLGTLSYIRGNKATDRKDDALAHDFSKVEPAQKRRSSEPVQEALPLTRDLPPIERVGNPLMSERIPRISLDTPDAQEEPQAPEQIVAPEPSESDKRAALRNSIPSLSGEFEPIVATPEEENTEVSKTGSFAAVGSAAAFEPVGDELVADLNPEERYVDDADDSEFEETVTESGAFAGPGYVEMPESRIGRFFGRFRKKEIEETSASDWLDVDEDFNPTEVGAARGGWESFREDNDDDREAPTVDDFDDDDDPWNGGAFSKLREMASGRSDDDDDDEYAEDFGDDEADVAEETEGVSDASPVIERSSLSIPAVDADENERIAEEAKMVYSFRNPDVNTEVWFVALGAEYAGNSGMKAFLAEHETDLRGSIIINLEATGAGVLSFIEEEGVLLTRRPTSRLKRYLRKAAEITGVGAATERMTWRESAASLAMKCGLQAMTLAGMEGGKPAYQGQGNDVVENVNEELVAENAQFVLEIIKSI